MATQVDFHDTTEKDDCKIEISSDGWVVADYSQNLISFSFSWISVWNNFAAIRPIICQLRSEYLT